MNKATVVLGSERLLRLLAIYNNNNNNNNKRSRARFEHFTRKTKTLRDFRIIYFFTPELIFLSQCVIAQPPPIPVISWVKYRFPRKINDGLRSNDTTIIRINYRWLIFSRTEGSIEKITKKHITKNKISTVLVRTFDTRSLRISSFDYIYLLFLENQFFGNLKGRGTTLESQ